MFEAVLRADRKKSISQRDICVCVDVYIAVQYKNKTKI